MALKVCKFAKRKEGLLDKDVVKLQDYPTVSDRESTQRGKLIQALDKS